MLDPQYLLKGSRKKTVLLTITVAEKANLKKKKKNGFMKFQIASSDLGVGGGKDWPSSHGGPGGCR